MSHRFFLSRLSLLVQAALVAFLLGIPLIALAEPEWKASLGVGQEYSDNTDDHSEINADHFQEYAEDGSAEFVTYDHGKRQALILWAWNADVNMDPFDTGELEPARLWETVETFAAYAIESAVSATLQDAADAYAAARQEWEDEDEDDA